MSLSRDERFLMCLLKYSSTLSMKIATGVSMARSRGRRRLLVSLTHLNSCCAAGREVHEVVDDAAQAVVGDERVQPAADLQIGDHVEGLEGRHRDRHEPDVRPRLDVP